MRKICEAFIVVAAVSFEPDRKIVDFVRNI
ncbi:hypothetical protein ES703_49714 [subsurface metagenome]